ncbi:MAG: hypothetical protein C0490_12390, partial [Marivirga sp.]|nr:hypothetical protein [Marivirga sp.]
RYIYCGIITAMKKILVPSDFSGPSRQAYKFALELASLSGAEVFVLHVISFPIIYESTFGIQPYGPDTAEIKKIEGNATEAFERLKKEHPSPPVAVTFFPIHDYLLPGIQRFITQKKIDLVIMGTQGSSGMEEFFIGSNTEKVVRFSPVPVIALRNAPTISSIKNIVLASGLELNETEFISHVKTIQDLFSATLHVLWINSPSHSRTDKEAQEGLEEFCKHYKLKDYTINVRSSPHESTGIIDFVHEINAKMLVMATHARKGLSHLFNSSITESVVNHIDCPIWTYSLKKQ